MPGRCRPHGWQLLHCQPQLQCRCRSPQLPRKASRFAFLTECVFASDRQLYRKEGGGIQKTGSRWCFQAIVVHWVIRVSHRGGCCAGDSIQMVLPMNVRAERIQDSRANYSTVHVCNRL